MHLVHISTCLYARARPLLCQSPWPRLIPLGRVDQVDDLLSLADPLGVLQRDIRGNLKLPLSVSRQMRGDDAFGVGEQRMALGQGFRVGDIECGPEKPFRRVEGGEDVFRADERSSADVDEQRVGLEQRWEVSGPLLRSPCDLRGLTEFLRVQEVLRLRRAGETGHEDVGLFQERLEGLRVFGRVERFGDRACAWVSVGRLSERQLSTNLPYPLYRG